MTMRFGDRPCNGTEGDNMRAQLCDRCAVDHGWHLFFRGHGDQPAESCPIMMSALVGPYDYPNAGPPEWGHDLDTGEWRCLGFQGPCACDVMGAGPLTIKVTTHGPGAT